MLDINLQELIYSYIPTSLTIDDSVFEIQTTLGEVPLNSVECPTVNLSFIGNGTPYFRSIDQTFVADDQQVTGGDIRTVILRYKCGSVNIKKTVQKTIMFRAGQVTYPLQGPVVVINSIEGFTITDYRLDTTRNSVTWIGQTPSPDTAFIISYDRIYSGYYLASKIIEYVIKDILGNSRIALATFEVDVLEVNDIVDISSIYSNTALTALAVDVQITYPFKWTQPTQIGEAVRVEEIRIHDLS